MAKLPNYKLDLSKIEILLKQKFEKVQNASEDNFAALTADGNFKDSGKKASSFLANAAKVITKFYLGSDIAGRNLEQDTDGSLKLKENISVSSVVSASISTNSLSTSSISGIDADDIPEGTVNKFYTDAKARAAISSTATGISYSGSSGVISLTSNYVIPTTTEKANYDTAYANNHLHGNKSNLDSVNQNLGTSSSPSFANLTTTSDITVNKTASSASAILSLKSKQDYSSVIRLYENTGSDVLRGQLAYRADLNATELRNPQTNGGVVSLPDYGTVTLDGGGTNGQVYISKGNLKIGNELGGVLKATAGTVSGNATTGDLPDSTDKRYCTDAQKTIINNTSGVNTGDETASTIKTKLGSASSSTDGYLTSSDWNTFSNKEPAISKNTAFNKNYETSTANIKMAGTASVGTTDTIARADHVHPSDTSKLSLTGGTITGELNAFSRLQQTVVLQRLKSIVTSPSNIKRVIFFDETGATATLKDRSTNLSNAALSADASSLNPDISGNCRVLNFNGTTYFEFPDADDLSFGNGTSDNPFSIVALINPNTVTSSCILGKNSTSNREWYLTFNSTKRLIAVFYDESTGGNIQTYTSARDADIGSWHTYFLTYNGSSTPAGMNLYCDGTILTSTDAGGTYTAMENLSSTVGNRIAGGSKGNSKYGFIAVIAEELSSAQVKEIDSLLRSYIGIDAAYL